MSDFRLTSATEDDIPFIMSTERKDGYDAVVGRWNEDRHRLAISDGSHAYFVGHVDLEPIGFGILRDWCSPDQVTLIKRLAVCNPGKGHGRQMLSAIAAVVFQQTPAYRLWLGVFPENTRARRAYEAVGFVAEGVARGSAYFGGIHRDELFMSILRPDWLASQKAIAAAPVP